MPSYHLIPYFPSLCECLFGDTLGVSYKYLLILSTTTVLLVGSCCLSYYACTHVHQGQTLYL